MRSLKKYFFSCTFQVPMISDSGIPSFNFTYFNRVILRKGKTVKIHDAVSFITQICTNI